MTETEAMCTGKTLVPKSFNSVILQLKSFPFKYFHSDVTFFLDLTSKLMESLEQIAAFDVEKLLSKSTILSENLLLQLWQSLTKEWGAGSISTVPEDFIQKLLTEVWFYWKLLSFSYYSHTCIMSQNILFKLPSLNFLN